MTLTIAIIAPGAMGSAMGERLREHGARVLTSLAGRSRATAERAAAAGMTDASDDMIAAEADIVLSVLPPAEVVLLAERFREPFLRANRARLFIDFNAINPDTLRAVQDASGLPQDMFVDGAIIGLPPKPGQKGPTFHVSGPAASRATALVALGLDVKVMDAPLGAASALKMCYAGITKGFTAIGAAMILLAARSGASEALAQELEATQPALSARLRTAMPDMLPKAYRWVAEMHEIANFVGKDISDHLMYQGAAALYERLSTDTAGEAKILTEFAQAAAVPAIKSAG